MTVAIIDYGMGNLRSVQKACVSVGLEAVVTGDADIIRAADKVILPGVGAFEQAVERIRRKNIDKVIAETVKKEKPLLGICLGMQLLYEKSYENGAHAGLGILKGEVKKFEVELKVPHVGWNNVTVMRETPLLEGINNLNFYFVHSYYVSADAVSGIATCNYGIDFTACAGCGNVYGTQFHPEKSGDAGLKILKNFGELK